MRGVDPPALVAPALPSYRRRVQLTCPRLTRELLARDCAALLAPGDTVMVHASLRAVGEVLGGPDEVIAAILDALGESGTMMMYISCQSPIDDSGRGIYSADDEAFIIKNCPPFDPIHSRAARDFGALAEFFRGHPRVRCSINPGARMAAVGARADELTRDHPRDHGYGRDSPLGRLCRLGGKVLLLGSDPDQVTLLHYAEAVAPIPNKRVVHIRTPALEHGQRVWHSVEEYDTSAGIVDWPDQFFARITHEFIAAGHARTGRIGGATSHLLPAQALVDFAVPIMVETAASLA